MDKTSKKKLQIGQNIINKKTFTQKKHWKETMSNGKKGRQLAGKVEDKNTSNLSDIVFFLPFNICLIWRLLYSTLFGQRFLPFDVTSHSTFITFNIISSQSFLLLDILSRSTFITFILVSFRHYLPFDVLSFQRFLLFNVFSVDPFVPIRRFVRRRFLRVASFTWHFVGESENKRPTLYR
jgi:hypothetical protein